MASCARAILFFLTILIPVFAAEPKLPKWEAMDYGPFLSLTLNMGKEQNGRDGAVLKTTIVRLGDKEHSVCLGYDTELMRVAVAWRGGFIDYKGVAFDGQHHSQPRPKGEILFTTKQTPGWAVEGKFADPRTEKRGPLPKSMLRFRGLYRYGHETIFSYAAGGCEVLECPGSKQLGDTTLIVREFNLGPGAKDLTLLLTESDAKEPGVVTEAGRQFSFNAGKHSLAGFVDGDEQVKIAAQGNRLTLNVPAHFERIAFKVVMYVDSILPKDSEAAAPPRDLTPLTKGGPQLWPQTVTTSGKLGSSDGPYAVDTLTLPDDNPYHAWMRPGGFDFFEDGKRAAVCTWSGDVWIVSGLDDSLGKLTWKRFATGLYQPLGLKILEDIVHVTCRDRIVRLHDMAGLGEADYYESLNDDFILSYHFHEFMMDLQADEKGSLYFAKGGTPGVGGPNFDVVTPHNGCFFKLSDDGQKLEIIARGLRAPNGIGMGPHGELTSGDNEGSWVPVCPINEIKPHGFVGVVPESWPGEPPPDHRDPPICWIPWNVDNSAGGQVWVTSKKFGPFENEMLHLSYGKCSLFHVLTERIGGQIQGGVAKLPLQFDSGVMRARFSPLDGQLYVCGLKGWQTTAAKDGTFQRVRYTGKPVNLPAELHVTPTGLKVKFTGALDTASAGDVTNYGLWWFDVKWTKDYGSDRWSPTDPGKKWAKQAVDPPGEVLQIKSVTCAADGKTVEFEIPGIKPVSNMMLRMKIKAADGSLINQEICNTIHRVPVAQ